MKKLVMGLVASLGFLVNTPTYGAVTTNISLPISLSVFVPCAAGGAGEVVTLNGNLHVLFSVTVNANHISFQGQFQPQGVDGVGSTTGDNYQGTGVTRFNFEADVLNFPFNTTFVNNFRIIGAGPGNNFLAHETFHITVNADGTVTASIDNFSIDCK